jgi:serine/threonine-protein kinase
MTGKSLIAVLPFANMSRDPDDDYFSDGLAEEIINALARMPGLKVTSRTSAFAFRGKEQDITKIAEALRVRTVLEGSVRRSGSRIRVTAQLISAADGYHLWSERYDREMVDLFALQDEIAAAIAKALQLMLSGKPVESRRHTPALLAHDAHLKGRHLLENGPGVGRLAGNAAEVWERSKEYFHQAIRLDANYAEPHIGLGSCYLRHAIEGPPPHP